MFEVSYMGQCGVFADLIIFDFDIKPIENYFTIELMYDLGEFECYETQLIHVGIT